MCLPEWEAHAALAPPTLRELLAGAEHEAEREAVRSLELVCTKHAARRDARARASLGAEAQQAMGGAEAEAEAELVGRAT